MCFCSLKWCPLHNTNKCWVSSAHFEEAFQLSGQEAASGRASHCRREHFSIPTTSNCLNSIYKHFNCLILLLEYKILKPRFTFDCKEEHRSQKLLLRLLILNYIRFFVSRNVLWPWNKCYWHLMHKVNLYSAIT